MPSIVKGSPSLIVVPPAVNWRLTEVHLHRLGAGDAGLAHAARHHRRVRRATATRGEHALGGDHAVHVVRVGLDAHEDDLLALLGQLLGAVGVEHRLAVRSAR